MHQLYCSKIFFIISEELKKYIFEHITNLSIIMQKRYFLKLQYDGTDFCGWQRQNNAVSVQQVIEECLVILLKEATLSIVGCGRTDTGVHAHEYFAHLDSYNILDDKFKFQLNAILPKSISILSILEVKNTLHARFDAKSRTYKYFIHKVKNPFKTKYSFLLPNIALDISMMNEFVANLKGSIDCSAFEKKGSDNNTSICKISYAFWEQVEDGYVFTITADRFLRNMVRSIVGTSLMIGSKRESLNNIMHKVVEKEQINVTLAAPACGLFLWSIQYDF